LDRCEQANFVAQWIWVILSSLASQAVTAQLAGWEVGHTWQVTTVPMDRAGSRSGGFDVVVKPPR
jgi:hypothetical protein